MYPFWSVWISLETNCHHDCRPPATTLKKNGLGRGWRCFKASPPKKASKVLFQVHHRRSSFPPSAPARRLWSSIRSRARAGWWWTTPLPPKKTSHATLTLQDAHVNTKSTLHPNWPFSSSSCDLSNRPTTTHHPPVCREKYSKVVSKKA